MNINTQINLENDLVKLFPLRSSDFEDLYVAAADPKIWEQHPNKNRWQREVFKNYFEGAMESKGAYKIIEVSTGKIIGSTRFYDFDKKENSILIGYTFFARSQWGKGTNHAVKTLMLNYAFQYVAKVIFHIGAENFRSQISIKRLGAVEEAEIEVAYFAEAVKLNKVFSISKVQWTSIEVRQAKESDIKVLLEFEKGIVEAERPFDNSLKQGEIHYYDLLELIKSPKAEVLVAVAKGQLVGSGYAKIIPAKAYQKFSEYAYLGFMYVLPLFRGQGVNKKILDALTEWSKLHNITELRLEVYKENLPALRAYEKAGFSPNLLEMRIEI